MRRLNKWAALLLWCLPAFGTVRNVQTYGATGNGITNDSAAINSAIAALLPGDTLLFPCGAAGIYAVNATFTVAVNNVTVQGSTGCGGGQVQIQGTNASGYLLSAGHGGVTSSTPLLGDAAVGDTSFTASVSALGGVAVGDFILLQEGGVDFSTDTAPGHPTQCDISGCRGEVLQVASVVGNTIGVTTSLHYLYNVAVNAANAEKLTSVTSGMTIENLTVNGTGAMSSGLGIFGLVNSTVFNVLSTNFANGAVGGEYAFYDIFSSGTITLAGSHAACAVDLGESGHGTFTNVSLSGLNTNSPTGFVFGFCVNTTADNTGTNVDANMTGSGPVPGRAIKFTAASFGVWTNLSAEGASGDNNGLNLAYYSSSNTFVNGSFTNNGNSGVETFGNYNQNNTFSGMACSSNLDVCLSQGVSALGNANDDNLTISGGVLQQAGAFGTVQVRSNNFYLHGATVGISGAAGVDFLVTTSGVCINSNVFVAGMTYAYAANSSTGFANSNTLNGNTTPGGALPTGACGTTPPAGNPGAPARAMFASVKNGSYQHF